MEQAKVTTDHDEIKKWAEKYHARPQIIDDPKALGDMPGLRIDFPGTADDPLVPKRLVTTVSWEEFFKTFDELKLAFVYIDEVDLKDPFSLNQAYRFVKREALRQDRQDPMVEDFMKEFISYKQASR